MREAEKETMEIGNQPLDYHFSNHLNWDKEAHHKSISPSIGKAIDQTIHQESFSKLFTQIFNFINSVF